ncbi:MAG: hypothetical protein MI745_06670 [Pseudomonadales bacterium]|nr:hypothetical protein [Pseudomonadales bacterium]
MADKRTLIPAGSTVVLRAVGDFVFCKFSDRPLILNIQDGQGNSDGPVEVKNGSMRRPPGGVAVIEVTNPDPDNECAAVFFIGKGDFDDKIIQGEVSVLPGIRGADGSWKDDTRHTIELDLYPARNEAKSWPLGTPFRVLRDLEYNDYRRETGLFVTQGPGGFYQFYSESLYDQNLGVWQGATCLRAWTADGVFMGDSQRYQMGTVADAAYFDGDWHIKTSSANAWEIIRGLDPSGPVFWSCPDNANIVTFCTWKDGQHLVVRDSLKRWWKVAKDGTHEQFPEPAWLLNNNNLRIRWDDRRGVGVIAYYSQNFMVVNEDLSQIVDHGDISGSAYLGSPAIEGFAPLGRFVAIQGTGASTHASDGQVGVYAYEEITDPARFNVTKAGCVVPAGYRFIPSADVALTQGASLVTVQGEVIKAALEMYFSRVVGAGYLDHVYRFEASSSQFGGRATVLEGGSRSLQARGYTDHMTIFIPCRVAITIDDDLPLE